MAPLGYSTAFHGISFWTGLGCDELLLHIEIVFGKKERRRYSLNRGFAGDYIGLEQRPELRALISKRDKVEFAETITKYDRRFRVSWRFVRRWLAATWNS